MIFIFGFVYEYFSFSLTWDHNYGCKNFKALLLPQITFESFFKLFLKFILSCPHKSTVSHFWNFKFYHFSRFFLRFCCSFPLTWDPMGAKTSKRYSSLKSHLRVFFSNFFFTFSSVVVRRVLFWIFEIWSFRFLALLDCVSRANSVARASVVRRPSVVRKMRFLRNRQAN